MSKKYKLLKDLPDAGTGTEYYLNGDNYYKYRKPDGRMFELSEGKGISYRKLIVESSPTWWEEVKPERIEVIAMEYTGHSFEFTTTKSFSDDKFPLIKQAIERVLNDEYHNLNGAYLDIEREKAFNAAREVMQWASDEYKGKYITGHYVSKWKFDTHQDYLNSIKQKTGTTPAKANSVSDSGEG